MSKKKDERLEREEVHELREILEILKEIRSLLRPRLSAVKLVFGGKMLGPITLTPTAKGTTATVIGFDQNGAVFNGTIPQVTFTPDVTTFCTFAPSGNSDSITGVADGTTNYAASLTTAEGVSLSDTTQIVTSGFVVTPPQILTSIKIDFTPAA